MKLIEPGRGHRAIVANLRRARLVALDLAGILGVWSLGVFAAPRDELWRDRPLSLALLVIAGVAVASLAAQRLYLARVCALRSTELRGIARTGLLTGVAALVLLPQLDVTLSVTRVVTCSAVMVVLLAGIRSGFAYWLSAWRARGRFVRRLLLVGTNEESRRILDLVNVHPEMGYRIVGVVGDEKEWAVADTEVPWLGETREAPRIAAREEAAALVAVTSLPPDDLDRLLARLIDSGVRVHASVGVTQIDQRRLRRVPFSHEPLVYVEPNRPGKFQDLSKRALDLVVAALVMIVTAPLLGAAALAVAMEGGRPIFFLQERVGRDGVRFQVRKLRTMVKGASSQLDDLKASNERRGGPLFKLDADPRVTKVGRVLRSTSIDELPQLWNVLKGEMSLVGPRPALPAEVAEFDDELLRRHRVRPGITGLWQLEARNNPAFSAYRRLDLFYVDNRSSAMDLAILLETAVLLVATSLQTLGRIAGGMLRHRSRSHAEASRKAIGSCGDGGVKVASGAIEMAEAGARSAARKPA